MPVHISIHLNLVAAVSSGSCNVVVDVVIRGEYVL